jgi:hypothetical protein
MSYLMLTFVLPVVVGLNRSQLDYDLGYLSALLAIFDF